MNAILFADSNGGLTDSDREYIKKAKYIIENGNKKLENKPRNKKKWVIPLVITIIIVILAIIFCTGFAIVNIKSNKILKNVSVMGIDISELTIDQAKQKINDNVNEKLTTEIVFKHNDQTFLLIPKQIEFTYDVDDVVNEAYLIGRNKSLIENNFTILKHIQGKSTDNLIPDINLNSDLLQSCSDQINSQITDAVQEPSYEIDGKKLIITAGKDGYKVKQDDLKQKIITEMTNNIGNSSEIEIPFESAKCQSINIEEIHQNIYKEPVDASYTTNPFSIKASSNGLDFAISVDEAKKKISGNDETYTIPLKTLYPKVSTDDIGQEAFPDLLASYSTSYASSSSNRANNVALATSKINGIVLMPGETFSYNQTVGQRTLKAGFKEAGAYANGQVVSSVGGGICQVSSTLYNAVLRANLDIVDRSNHMFAVGYVPIGTDATVSWGAPDFKFKNSRTYPIKIVASTSGRKCYIRIFGLKENNEYDVEIQSYSTGSIPYKTTYITDNSLGAGKTKVIQNGSNGATSVTYRILKQNGKIVSKNLISKDTYQPHNKIIARGN